MSHSRQIFLIMNCTKSADSHPPAGASLSGCSFEGPLKREKNYIPQREAYLLGDLNSSRTSQASRPFPALSWLCWREAFQGAGHLQRTPCSGEGERGVAGAPSRRRWGPNPWAGTCRLPGRAPALVLGWDWCSPVWHRHWHRSRPSRAAGKKQPCKLTPASHPREGRDVGAQPLWRRYKGCLA